MNQTLKKWKGIFKVDNISSQHRNNGFKVSLEFSDSLIFFWEILFILSNSLYHISLYNYISWYSLSWNFIFLKFSFLSNLISSKMINLISIFKSYFITKFYLISISYCITISFIFSQSYISSQSSIFYLNINVSQSCFNFLSYLNLLSYLLTIF